MRGIGTWWQERRTCRENAAYLQEEVQIIDLAALERELEAQAPATTTSRPSDR